MCHDGIGSTYAITKKNKPKEIILKIATTFSKEFADQNQYTKHEK